MKSASLARQTCTEAAARRMRARCAWRLLNAAGWRKVTGTRCVTLSRSSQSRAVGVRALAAREWRRCAARAVRSRRAQSAHERTSGVLVRARRTWGTALCAHKRSDAAGEARRLDVRADWRKVPGTSRGALGGAGKVCRGRKRPRRARHGCAHTFAAEAAARARDGLDGAGRTVELGRARPRARRARLCVRLEAISHKSWGALVRVVLVLKKCCAHHRDGEPQHIRDARPVAWLWLGRCHLAAQGT